MTRVDAIHSRLNTKSCEECGKSENVLLQEVLGHYYCTGCLTVAMNGGKPAIKSARQLRLDESISTSDAPVAEEHREVYWPGEHRASRARQTIDFEEERKLARQRILAELADFRKAHNWVKPGMVVVNIATGDLAVIRASTNPEVGWTTTYLTTEHSLGMSRKPVVPSKPHLRIADASEYAEARELLQSWPTKAKAGLYIGEPGDAEQELFNEQFFALLQEVSE